MPKYICTKCGETFEDWDELIHEAFCPDCKGPVEDFDKAFQRAFIEHSLQGASPRLMEMWKHFQSLTLEIRPVCFEVSFETPGAAQCEHS